MAIFQQRSLLQLAFEPGRKQELSDSQIKAMETGESLPSVEQIEPETPPEISGSTGGYYQRLATLMAEVCQGIQHLHDFGIVHRDIKPGNLMLTRDGQRIILMDLGLAQVKDASMQLTGTSDHFLGTLRYMAPEQMHRKLLEVDHRADVYAVGATVYELACLRPVYVGDTEQELIRQKLQDEPLVPIKANPKIPKDLAAIIESAVQRKPTDRYQTALAMAEDLQAFSENRPVSAKRFGRFHYLKLFAQRNKMLVTTISLSLLVLIAVLTGSAIWNLKERQKAQREAETAQQVSDFLVEGAYKRMGRKC
ncbi:serine/threonine protein kinase [candidate division CSSED10-310 bacterium]|uniref:Serine/threonine protein kinase n=1 Tax=candidate division CSSED10-310 bacterium TaxID=2855610 RepID=A0ABV6YTR8_UNCC1